MTLKELLKNWEDQDVASYYLACSLGLMNYDSSFENFRNLKWIFWTGNNFQKMFSDILKRMLEMRILEQNEADKYRWNPEFRGDWEIDLTDSN